MLISSLENVKIADLHSVFNLAFANYPIKFNLSQKDFERKFITKLQLDRGLSAGAFEGEQLAGFIFQTLGEQKGRKVAYNGGTGVLPDYRGHKLTHRMYDFLAPLSREAGVSAFLLECITHNSAAVKAYKDYGFSIVRLFRCYFLEKKYLPIFTPKLPVTIAESDSPDWNQLKELAEHQPAFEEELEQIKRNTSLYTALEARVDEQMVGYLLFDKMTGRIAFLATASVYRRQGVAAALLRHMAERTHAPVLTAVNVDESASDLCKFFSGMTFENRFDQYEMIYDL